MLVNDCLIAYAKKLAVGKEDFQSATAVAGKISEDSSLHLEA